MPTYIDTSIEDVTERRETERLFRRDGRIGQFAQFSFPETLNTQSSYNNHFMQIDILQPATFGSSGRTASGQQPSSGIKIALYMPNSVQFTSQNEYEDISLTSLAANLIVGGGTARRIEQAARILDKPINPKTEVMFSNVRMRTFTFEFLFAPVTRRETDTLKQIIGNLRNAAAPDIQPNTATLLWIPPQKLRIKFYSTLEGRTQENPYLPKLKDLVIEAIDLDYAPTGVYSTFKNGHPVSVRMMLRLKEDEIIDKDFIKNNDL